MKKILFSVLIAVAFVAWSYMPSISQSLTGGATNTATLETDNDSLIILADSTMKDIAAIKDDVDNIYSRLDSVYRCSWAREVVHDGHNVTTADTTFLTTGWNVADGGKIYLQVYGNSITGSGGEPLIIAKAVEEGRWNQLYLQYNDQDPTDTLVIADGSNSYNTWLTTGYNATLKSTDNRIIVFGDSICIILLPDDVSSGAIDMTGRYQKE